MNNKTNKTTSKQKQVSEVLEEKRQHITDPKFKRFYLRRKEDISGVSGIGYVAAGCQFEDGTVMIKWLTTTSSISIFHSVVEMEYVHGHNGSTVVEWVD